MFILDLADNIGNRIGSVVRYTLQTWTMVYVSFRSVIINRKHNSFREIFKVISTQIYFTGFQALPLISMLALIAGTLIIIQSSSQLSKVGGGDMLGNLVVVLIIRELGPLMTALVVIARSGTAIASELGNMKVNGEIDALESMGINPLSYIVFPRLLGGIISVVCLALYFCIVALFGGYFIGQFVQPISFSFYIDSIAYAISSADVWLFLLKNLFSGGMIFIICCYQGLLVKQSFTEVPQVTTKAVVNSIMYTVGFNSLVSLSVYLQNLRQLGLI
ncbi:MAG: ABC transporter permease [Oligoflexia bacterium]|nr:ABC transporter permease [Oligoflexia bacterium]